MICIFSKNNSVILVENTMHTKMIGLYEHGIYLPIINECKMCVVLDFILLYIGQGG